MGTRLYVNTKDALTLDMLADVPRGTYAKYNRIMTLSESAWQLPGVRKRLMKQKAPKYFKRVAAPYPYSVFGSINSVVEDELGTVVEFELDNGYIGTHRNIKLDNLDPVQYNEGY